MTRKYQRKVYLTEEEIAQRKANKLSPKRMKKLIEQMVEDAKNGNKPSIFRFLRNLTPKEFRVYERYLGSSLTQIKETLILMQTERSYNLNLRIISEIFIHLEETAELIISKKMTSELQRSQALMFTEMVSTFLRAFGLSLATLDSTLNIMDRPQFSGEVDEMFLNSIFPVLRSSIQASQLPEYRKAKSAEIKRLDSLGIKGKDKKILLTELAKTFGIDEKETKRKNKEVSNEIKTIMLNEKSKMKETKKNDPFSNVRL